MKEIQNSSAAEIMRHMAPVIHDQLELHEDLTLRDAYETRPEDCLPDISFVSFSAAYYNALKQLEREPQYA